MRKIFIAGLLLAELSGCSGMRALPNHSVESQVSYSIGSRILGCGMAMSTLGVVGGGWAIGEHQWRAAGLAAGGVAVGILGIIFGRMIMVEAAKPVTPAPPSWGERARTTDDDAWLEEAEGLAKAVRTSTAP